MMKLVSVSLAACLALAAFGTGCGSHADPQEPSDQNAPVAAPETKESESVTPQTTGPCPYQWTCDYRSWYTVKSSCVAACGTKPCVYDEHYNGHCIPR